jgi:hypothetical protein
MARQNAITEGTVLPVRPDPMIGGMITAPLLSMLVIPAAWFLMRRRHLNIRSTIYCLKSIYYKNYAHRITHLLTLHQGSGF